MLCTRRPATFARARAREKRLEVSGNPRQYDDLGLIVDEQERLRRLAERSRLPRLELDDVAGAADRVADWLESTGGLWAKEG